MHASTPAGIPVAPAGKGRVVAAMPDADARPRPSLAPPTAALTSLGLDPFPPDGPTVELRLHGLYGERVLLQ